MSLSFSELFVLGFEFNFKDLPKIKINKSLPDKMKLISIQLKQASRDLKERLILLKWQFEKKFSHKYKNAMKKWLMI